MSNWRKAVRCRMSKAKTTRAWMAWAIWGMLGTAFTMEGTTGAHGIGGLGMAVLLTGPFWLAFALWPIFRVWRLLRDRGLWTEKIECLIHDPEKTEPFGLEVLFGRDGVRVAEDEVLLVEGAADALKAVPVLEPDAPAGLPFRTYAAGDLAAWGAVWLETHSEEGPLTDFARWTDTLRHAARAACR